MAEKKTGDRRLCKGANLPIKNGYLKYEDDKESHKVHVCQLYHGASMAS